MKYFSRYGYYKDKTKHTNCKYYHFVWCQVVGSNMEWWAIKIMAHVSSTLLLLIKYNTSCKVEIIHISLIFGIYILKY